MTHKVNIKGGSHPALADYCCEACGVVIEDVFFASRAAITATVKCVCGSAAERLVWATRRNFIHPSHSSMYGKEHPAFGQVVDDYAHKQRLMKEYGVMEGADPVKGSRHHRKAKPERPADLPKSTWVDNLGDTPQL